MTAYLPCTFIILYCVCVCMWLRFWQNSIEDHMLPAHSTWVMSIALEFNFHEECLIACASGLAELRDGCGTLEERSTMEFSLTCCCSYLLAACILLSSSVLCYLFAFLHLSTSISWLKLFAGFKVLSLP